MALHPLKEHEKPFVAAQLAKYWQSRKMDYDEQWAEEYLQRGHRERIINDEFFLYKVKGKVVGMASLVSYEGGVAEIRDDIVLVEAGDVLKSILNEIVEVAKLGGIRKVYSQVLKQNVPFYLAAGFSKEGELLDHFREGEDLAIMSKIIQ